MSQRFQQIENYSLLFRRGIVKRNRSVFLAELIYSSPGDGPSPQEVQQGREKVQKARGRWAPLAGLPAPCHRRSSQKINSNVRAWRALRLAIPSARTFNRGRFVLRALRPLRGSEKRAAQMFSLKHPAAICRMQPRGSRRAGSLSVSWGCLGRTFRVSALLPEAEPEAGVQERPPTPRLAPPGPGVPRAAPTPGGRQNPRELTGAGQATNSGEAQNKGGKCSRSSRNRWFEADQISRWHPLPPPPPRFPPSLPARPAPHRPQPRHPWVPPNRRCATPGGAEGRAGGCRQAPPVPCRAVPSRAVLTQAAGEPVHFVPGEAGAAAQGDAAGAGRDRFIHPRSRGAAARRS